MLCSLLCYHKRMTVVLRSLLLWLVLLAVPFQGYAAAAMPCAPAIAAAAQAATHDHAAMLASQHASPHETDQAAHHGGKCGNAAACCSAAALAPPLPSVAAPPPHGSAAIPFTAGLPATVHLAQPERPPQATRA